MGPHQVLLAAMYLLGTLVASCFGQVKWGDQGYQVMLNGSNSKCQGNLEVQQESVRYTLCSYSWDLNQNYWKDFGPAPTICRQLQCGSPLALTPMSSFNRPQKQITCRGPRWSFSNCTIVSQPSCDPLGLVCQAPPFRFPPPSERFIAEPQRTMPPPTSTLPTTTVPPRLQLVAGYGGLQCTGVVVFYSGSQGGTILYEAQDRPQGLGNLICSALQCGSFLTHLGSQDADNLGELRDPRLLPVRWAVQNWSCASLEQCFQKTQVQEGGQMLTVICSDFQPKVQSRLVGASSMCEGIVEVRQGSQWAALCDSSATKSRARWEELCQEQQCGGLISFRATDAGRTSPGLFCSQEKLSRCYQLQKRSYCKRVSVTCQDPNPAGLAAGTVASIILTLVLLVVLLVMCGPLVYRKLVKKFRQKKQRQWIGPTGVNQNMSFHRNHTATVRSQVENPPDSRAENEYSQPPRNSHLSAYPALEGALHRSSTQPDNSSDSDYDLQVAQRL